MADQNEKVVELEMRISVMEKGFDELSDVVSKQWQMLDRLTSKITVVESQLEGKQDRSDGSGIDQPPPHY